MDKNQLIISLTSYPKRIKYVKQVLESIVNTTIDKSLYKIVLVLSIEEFPNKNASLPYCLVYYCEQNNIEILWNQHNTRSHKKLIPTILKYPDNDILIIDDDIIRSAGWLNMFLQDRKKLPNSILTMWANYYINEDFHNVYDFEKYKEIKHNTLLQNFRPANGYGGTLYPAHTFTDYRFFDEKLYMKLSPSSDEMWQWCFNIMYDQPIIKTARTYQLQFIKNSQEISLYNENKNIYDDILNNLLNYFPVFKEKLMDIIKNKG